MLMLFVVFGYKSFLCTYYLVFYKASWVLFLTINLYKIYFCLVFSCEIHILSDTNERRFHTSR